MNSLSMFIGNHLTDSIATNAWLTASINGGIFNPVVMVPLAIFLAVASVSWLVMSKVSGSENDVTESRLQRLKVSNKSSKETDANEKARNKSDAFAAALERATSPLASKVTGSEAEMSKLRELLVNGGFRRESAPVIYKVIQLGCTLIGLLLGGALGIFTDGLTQGLLIKSAGGMVLGFAAPHFIMKSIVSKRKESIFLGLPDSLDLMVVCVEAGLGMDQALRKVADVMKSSHKVIGEEFAIANQQLQFGRPRAEVLTALGYRSGVDDLKQLANILIQADKFGSSVGTALRVQSDSMRCKRRQIAEEKAAKTAVKMIFPLVLFIFPGIFVVLVGPAAINMHRQLLSE